MLGKISWYSIDVSGNDRHILLFDKKCHFCLLLPFAKVVVISAFVINLILLVNCYWFCLYHVLYPSQSATDKSHAVRFSGYIDLGRELALTHSLLAEAMEKCDKVGLTHTVPSPVNSIDFLHICIPVVVCELTLTLPFLVNSIDLLHI